MKRLMITTAMILATTTASFATSSDELRESVKLALSSYQTDIVVDALTDEQVAEINLTLNSGNSSSEIQSALTSIEGTMGNDDASMLRAKLADTLATRQMEISVVNLSDEQVIELTSVLNSGNSAGEIASMIESIVGAEGNTDTTELRAGLETKLQGFPLDISVNQLTDDQVINLSLIMNSGDSNSDKIAKAKSVILK